MSKFCAIKKAIPDPKAILIEIISSKFVEIINVNKTPMMKPKQKFSCYKTFHKLYYKDQLLRK